MRRLLYASLLSVGCVVPDVAVEGHPCPCPDGYACDGATQTCVRGAVATTSSGLGGGAASGSSSSGVAVCAGVCGTPGCGACPDVPVIDAGGFGIDALEATRGDYLRFLSDAADVSLQSPQCQWNTTFEPDPSAGCTDVADAMKAGFPITCVDWCDAAAFCAWAGKRLCGRRGGGTLGESGVNDPAASEWYAACSADGALAFPYGDSFVPETCNALGSPNGGMFTGAGWYVGCEGGYPGLFDMVGNVEEWEDACTIGPDPAADNCFLRGGAFWSDETVAVCASNFERSPDRSATSDDWGFRCCKDL